jgi:anti-sigma regulatory factor (Ser/Thr protein kinase)
MIPGGSTAGAQARSGGREVASGLDLAGTPASVGAARSFVRAALRSLELEELVDTAVLLVSELATNAVLHARTAYRVEVDRVGDAVRISVLDGSPVQVHRRVHGLEAATGRGLGLVEAMALRWGPTGTDGLGEQAKGIWFELPTDPALLRPVVEGGLYGERWA